MSTFIRTGMCLLLSCSLVALAQSKHDRVDKFRQLEEILPTPNMFRTASGAPGPRYWQQRADYKMDLRLDDEKQRLEGSETITYYNLSPDTLGYLWVQLDQNRFHPESDENLTRTAPDLNAWEEPSYKSFQRELDRLSFPGGYEISNVRDKDGKPLSYTINKTMLRIDLPARLVPGETFTFSLDWSYNIVEQKKIGGRGGYEYFKKDDNYLYEIAQFFPRMAAYTDVNGWQNKQFLGDGEFALEFGDYEVSITAPADHVVTATGVLQNPNDVLTKKQRDRLKKAEKADKPVLVITEDEAEKNEKSRSKKTKTWVFHAENVRDFAFASSRKFIWDAQGYTQPDGSLVMAMSLYPKEGNPLWERYSTHSIIHTMEEYGKYTFIYPYPMAISVNGPVGGMEYPMICFNGPRPEEDKTYTPRKKYGLISVIIHEVGHNYFPMIVNSDERQWTWMDEGLNSFLQYIAEQSWEDRYPSRRGEPRKIVEYMASDNQVPIMTNSESLLQFGANAYGKPATALNILRETIMGRELFDFAFREFAQRWKFKRPQPADFFRTMEDASAVDLDWFWRGWFYSTDHVDIAITGVRHLMIDTRNPDVEHPIQRQEETEAYEANIGNRKNKENKLRVDAFPELKDFYNENDPFIVTEYDRDQYQKLLAELEPFERELLDLGHNVWLIDFENIGGLVMPILIDITYTDDTVQSLRIPAEIWRYNHTEVTKMLVTPKEIKSIMLDPQLETADTDLSNNHFPPRPVKSRFQLFKDSKEMNPMQRKNWKKEPGGTDD